MTITETRKRPCPACDSTGVVTSYDTVPYGSTTAQMPTDEYCTVCLMPPDTAQAPHCPACGEPVLWSEQRECYVMCWACGWVDPFAPATYATGKAEK